MQRVRPADDGGAHEKVRPDQDDNPAVSIRVNAVMQEAVPAGISVILMASLLLGCAQPPAQQFDAAQKSIEAARAGGAELYATEDFTKLKDEFAQANDELAKQEQTFSIFRSYGKADELLKRVAEHAKDVETAATKGKTEAKNAAYAGEQDAVATVVSAKRLLAKAPYGKDRAAVESIRQDLSGLESALAALHDLIEKADYLGAVAQAKAIKGKGEALREEIQKAIATLKRSTPPPTPKKS